MNNFKVNPTPEDDGLLSEEDMKAILAGCAGDMDESNPDESLTPLNIYVSFDYRQDWREALLTRSFPCQSEVRRPFEFSYFEHYMSTPPAQFCKDSIASTLPRSSMTLVLVGERFNENHGNAVEIGFANWQHFEIAKSIEQGNSIVFVKIDPKIPDPNFPEISHKIWLDDFSRASITDLLKHPPIDEEMK